MSTHAGPGPPHAARPTGTITFLFSDIEGSTARWDADRGAMAVLLARHDTIVRSALEAHGAYVFKTLGDAFCAAFTTPHDAIAAALEAQRELAAEDFTSVDGLRVRVAVHTGTADERDGDYFGPAVNRVSRLLAIGHGGQVLISGATAQLLRDDVPAECTLRDLGEHRLRDLAHAEHVYQLLATNLPQTFAPLRSLEHLSNNLPAQLSTFVGRESVIAEIATLIEQHRLVTLTGSGGAGKTRCAMQVGADVLDRWPDGVWLAELAPISDASRVAHVIAHALNLQEQPNSPVLDTLTTHLKRKTLLLILDNCEHVIDEVRRVVSAILQHSSAVHILATSRESLSLSAETTYRMPSLAVPSDSDVLFEEGISNYGAVQLFVDRAVSSNNHFVLAQANAPHVVEICRRLDGIPLAIELAAARLKVLSPKQLTEKLDERFRVLTAGDRSALPRHQTMRALIDWSYDLLSAEERAFFRKLSIFAGGFTFETAAMACGHLDDIATLELLSSLVDKSLVQADMAGDGTRYRLLESTRQYAREKLIAAGEYETAALAHARAFLVLAERLDRSWETTPDREWLAQLEPEMENVRAALGWAFGAGGDVLLGQQLVCAFGKAWSSIAPAEGRRRIELAREYVRSDTPETVLAALDLVDARLAGIVSEIRTSLAAGERALARYSELSDRTHIAEAQHWVGRGLAMFGKMAEGEALLHQSLAEVRALGARKSAAFLLRSLADVRALAGDVAGAKRIYTEALREARLAHAARLTASIAVNLAEAEFHSGDSTAALQLTREALATLRDIPDTRSLACALCNEAAYLTALHHYEEARVAAREGLAAARDAQLPVFLALTLQHLAAMAEPQNHRRAARLLGYVDARLAQLEASREYTEQRGYDAALAALRGTLGADELCGLMTEGSAWNEEQAVAEALLI